MSRFTIVVCGMMCAALLTAGCARNDAGNHLLGPGSADAIADIGDDVQSPWLFWPRRLRIHPLTRIVPAANGQEPHIIECRLEFLDRHDHPTKAVGVIAVDVSGERRGDVIASWAVDLRDEDENRRLFDPITGTYLLKLPIPSADTPLPAEIRVRYASGDGRRLDATSSLRWQPAETP